MTDDSEFSAGVRRSMAEPFTPLNRRLPKPAPKPNFWKLHSEEVGLFLWMFAMTLAGATLIMTLDKVEAFFR